MAVLGVMGCTALMVAGFGLRNSTGETMEKQFTDEDSIWCYDMQVVMNGSVDTTLFEAKAATILLIPTILVMSTPTVCTS